MCRCLFWFAPRNFTVSSVALELVKLRPHHAGDPGATLPSQKQYLDQGRKDAQLLLEHFEQAAQFRFGKDPIAFHFWMWGADAIRRDRVDDVTISAPPAIAGKWSKRGSNGLTLYAGETRP